MAGHIAQSTGTEVPPSTPVPRLVDLVVGTIGGRSEEEIPVQGLGYGVNLRGTHQTLRPDGTVGEGIHTGNLADLAVPDPVAHLLYALARRSLVTHLGSHAVLGSELGEQTRLVNGVRQRLLAIYVLAELHGVGSNKCVRVVRRSAHYGIDLVCDLVVHLAPVPEALCLRETVERALGIVPVRVAEGYDILLLEVVQHGRSASADTYTCDVKFVRGGLVSEG